MFDLDARRVFAQLSFLSLMALCFVAAFGSVQTFSECRNQLATSSVSKRVPEGHERFQEALRLSRAQSDAHIQLDCLINLGILNWNIGKVKESDDLSVQALSLSQEMGLKEQAARCTTYLRIYEAYVRGKEACASGLHRDSIDQFNIAIDLAKKIESPEHELKCLRQLSLNYHQIGAFSKFYLLNEMGLRIADKLHKKKKAGV
jgi:hypothetical protein